jgi:hypothetical protein
VTSKDKENFGDHRVGGLTYIYRTTRFKVRDRDFGILKALDLKALSDRFKVVVVGGGFQDEVPIT